MSNTLHSEVKRILGLHVISLLYSVFGAIISKIPDFITIKYSLLYLKPLFHSSFHTLCSLHLQFWQCWLFCCPGYADRPYPYIVTVNSRPEGTSPSSLLLSPLNLLSSSWSYCVNELSLSGGFHQFSHRL